MPNGRGLSNMEFQAFLITFREALEALLIIGVITTYLNKIGQGQWKKWVWVGVLLAIIASFGTALLFQVVLTGFGTMASQVYLKFGIMFISVGLLTHMILFMAKQKKNMENEVHSKLSTILTTGSAINMIVHSFLVTLREGVETVFFFAAISGGDISKAISSWGALVGVIAACLLALIFFRGTKRVPLGTFFKSTGLLLMIIAAGLLVQGIGILQDLGYMGSVYRTAGGQIGEVYNITGVLPEHPIDAVQYERDTGHKALLSGQLGVFLKAIFGYSENPSVEEFVIYWGYYAFLLLLLAREKKKSEAEVSSITMPEAAPTNMKLNVNEAK
jgi:high-affinity iron transporter